MGLPLVYGDRRHSEEGTVIPDCNGCDKSVLHICTARQMLQVNGTEIDYNITFKRKWFSEEMS